MGSLPGPKKGHFGHFGPFWAILGRIGPFKGGCIEGYGPQMGLYGQYGPKWPKMAQNGPKRAIFGVWAQKGGFWAILAILALLGHWGLPGGRYTNIYKEVDGPFGAKMAVLAKMAIFGPKWPSKAPDHGFWPKMGQNRGFQADLALRLGWPKMGSKYGPKWPKMAQNGVHFWTHF